MNRYIEKVFIGFLFGIGAVIAAGIFVYVVLQIKSNDDNYNYETVEVDQKAITVKTGRLVKYGRHPMISTSVTNTLNINIDSVWVKAKLFDEKGLFGSCVAHTDPIAPGESREILLSCHEFETYKLPENTRFEVFVEQASYREYD